jgi:hypothetical protein
MTMPDDPKFWIAVSTSALALAGAIYTATVNYRGQQKLERLKVDLQDKRDDKKTAIEKQNFVSKYRDPLMHAAYDLQSRIFNILRQGFLTRYLINGSPHEQEYAIENTVFLLAQFLGWTEAIREEIQFLDLGADDQTKRLRQLQDEIYRHLQTDTLAPGFRLFAGEQRAIGELMIDRGASTCRCIGFAAFMNNRKPGIDRWLDPLRDDLRQMAARPDPFKERLASIQHSMIDLLEFLDPQFTRFPQSTRTRV